MSRPERDLSPTQRITFSMPQLGISISGTVMGSWLMFFLVPPESEIATGNVVLISAAQL